MAKIVKKEDLAFSPEGYIVDRSNEIIPIPMKIVDKINNLETAYQRAIYLEEQPEGRQFPTLRGFKRQSMLKKYILPTPSTPILDAREKEGLALAAEIEAINKHQDIENFIERNQDLLSWIDSDSVIVSESNSICAFDTPVIGNPLELTIDRVLSIISDIGAIVISDDTNGLAV